MSLLDESEEPLLEQSSSSGLADNTKEASALTQKLSNLNYQIDRSLALLSKRSTEVTESARKQIHGNVAEATQISYRIGKLLEHPSSASSSRIEGKIRIAFAKEVKKLNDLGRALAEQERRIMALANVENDEQSLLDFGRVVRKSGDRRGSQQAELEAVQMEALESSRVDLEAMEDRQTALKEISKDVRLLNEMMMDLSYLVEEQQDLVDHIESNVELGGDHVIRAEEEVLIASRYQRRARARMCCLLASFLFVLLALLLMIFLL